MLSTPRYFALIGVIAFCLLMTACSLTQSASAPTTPAPAIPPPAATVAPANPAPTTASVAAPTSAPAATAVPANSAPTTVARPASDAVRIEMAAGKSEARYRVREQLVGVSLPSDAIGRTKEVSGTIIAKPDGTIMADQSKFRVDLRTLKSDDNRRDNFLSGSTLETRRYPFAEFVPKEAQGLKLPLPKSGEIAFKLVGDLTIRNVTKPVTWEVKGKIEGDEAIGTAKTNFTFEYFSLTQPRVPVVLSLENNIILEVDLNMKRVASQ